MYFQITPCILSTFLAASIAAFSTASGVGALSTPLFVIARFAAFA